MAKQPSKRRQKQGIQILKQKGLLAIILGAAMLLVPPLFASSSILKPVASALRTPAWLALGVGVLLLGAYCIVKRMTVKAGDLTEGVAHAPSPAKSRGRLTLIEPTLAPAVEPTPPTSSPTPASTWSPAVFAAIEWRRFEVVCEALIAQPTCASCGVKMLERTPSKGNAAFWGCSNYPRCKFRLQMLAVR